MQWFLCDQKFDFAQLTERDDQKVSKTPKLKKKKKKRKLKKKRLLSVHARTKNFYAIN